MQLTLRQILNLPAVQAGSPELLSGSDSMESTVRWVHVAELTELSGLLGGGELVLTTGLGLGKSAAQISSYLHELKRLKAAGVIIELLDDRKDAVPMLREAATGEDIPVILVTKRIRFIEVTETSHRLILADQLDRLERARHVHEVFTLLSVESAGAQEIVSRTAALIDAPVVLEDISHLVVAFDARSAQPAELLQNWESTSRTLRSREVTDRSGHDGWLQTPVGLVGQRWGRLVVPTQLNGDIDDVSMVLERAAQALSINRMAERDQWELAHQAQSGLVQEMRQPRSLTETEALARASALGLRQASAYIPVVLRLDHDGQNDPIDLQRQERELLEAVTEAVRSTKNSALASSLQTGSVAVLLAIPSRQTEESVLQRVCRELRLESTGRLKGLQWTAGVGRARSSLLRVAAGLDEAAHVAEAASTLRTKDEPYYRASDVRLRGLLSLLRNDPRVLNFVEGELEPLLEPGGADDLKLLELYLDSGGNKAQLAKTNFMSRPTLYARLAHIEEELGVRLDDADSRTSLHVATLIHRIRHLK